MSDLRPVTVITGASSGIGAELARVFARNGHELALVARRQDRLSALADEIAAAGNIKPLVIVADLQRNDAAQMIGRALAAFEVEPQYIVNNAGFGLVGTAASLDGNEQLAMIDVNVSALTDLSLAFVDSLARHRGGILNVGSMAGFLPGPGMAVYYATKAFVLSFSEALHSELKRRGVRVSVLCPGPVPTEFAERAGVKGRSLAPSFLSQPAEFVAEAGYRGLMQGKRTIIPGLVNKLIILLIRVIPRGLLLAAVSARQSRRRSAQRT
ncbi:MAG TPA: SDR family oxidoreductase [Pseudolabrys sp.]|nr:SDR family oxidoreductase [Pseudolabrys sp.]